MKRITIFFASLAALFALGLSSCSDDDLGASIYNTDPSIDYLDKASATFPLDTFLKVNYLEPYNLRFIYRMEDIGSDLQKNLVPADYEKSCKLAVSTSSALPLTTPLPVRRRSVRLKAA